MTLIFFDASTNPSASPQEGDGGLAQMDREQRAAVIGDPVPVVWCRQRASAGGVLLSPPATECRFENDVNNDVTVWYHLLLSDGEIQGIQVRDLFHGVIRRGTITQSFDQRAGQWLPGNEMTTQVGFSLPDATKFCGSVGRCEGISTLSFTVTIDDPSTDWRKQVNLYVRGGVIVTRLDDAVSGSSDNYADLIVWLLQRSSRVPAALIDLDGMEAAANFTEANGYLFNGVIDEKENLPDLLERWSRYFLLRYTTVGGKHSLRPLLPLTGTAFNTGLVTWRMTFDELLVLPESVEVRYIPAAERRSIGVRVAWRQQLEDAPGFRRVAELRYAGTGEGGPFEEHDISQFCTTEAHAVKVAAYLLARRRYVTHTLRLTARPDWHAANLEEGDIVRVNLQRQAYGFPGTAINWLYEIDRITKSANGETTYEMTHFPIDADGQSLIAADVVAATGTGVIFLPNRTGEITDVNADDDTSVPTGNLDPPTPGDPNDPGYVDVGLDPDVDYGPDPIIELVPGDFDIDGTVADGGSGFPGGGGDFVFDGVNLGDGAGGGGLGGGGGASPGGGGGGETATDEDALDLPEPPQPTLEYPEIGAVAGNTMTAPTVCEGQTVQWLRDGSPISGATGSTYTPGLDDVNSTVTSEVTCGGTTFTPDGYFIGGTTTYTFATSANYSFTVESSYTVTTESCDPETIPPPPDPGGTTSNTYGPTSFGANVDRIILVTDAPIAGIGTKAAGFQFYTQPCGDGSTVERATLQALGYNGGTYVGSIGFFFGTFIGTRGTGYNWEATFTATIGSIDGDGPLTLTQAIFDNIVLP